MARCRMKRVPAAGVIRYRTPGGTVQVEQFKRGLWSVMARGQTPFTVRSKRAAFARACALER